MEVGARKPVADFTRAPAATCDICDKGAVLWIVGLAPELLDRHPFPGPGLAIRCLCTNDERNPQRVAEGWIIGDRDIVRFDTAGEQG